MQVRLATSLFKLWKGRPYNQLCGMPFCTTLEKRLSSLGKFWSLWFRCFEACMVALVVGLNQLPDFEREFDISCIVGPGLSTISLIMDDLVKDLIIVE